MPAPFSAAAPVLPTPPQRYDPEEQAQFRREIERAIHDTREHNEYPALHGEIYDKGGAVFNVKHPEFGAKGDDSADDTVAIQAAIDAAAARSSIGSPTDTILGAEVYVPQGTYNITDELLVPVNTSVSFRGVGGISMLKWASSTTDKAILHYQSGIAAADQTYGLSVRGLGFDFAAEGAPTGSVGLQLGDAGGVIHSVTVGDCIFYRGALGLELNSEADGINVFNNWFYNCTKGLRSVAGGGSVTRLLVCGNHFEQQNDWAIDHGVGGNFTAIGNLIQSVQAGLKGIRLEGAFSFDVSRNYFEMTLSAVGALLSVNAANDATLSIGTGVIELNSFLGATGSDVYAVRLGKTRGVRIGKNSWVNTKNLVQLDADCGTVDIDPRQSYINVTNKLLDNRSTKTPFQAVEQRVAITEAEFVSGLDTMKGDIFQMTLTANRIAGAVSGGSDGKVITFIIVQDAGGGNTLTLTNVGSNAWSDTGNTGNKISTIEFVHNGAGYFQRGAQSPYMA